MAQAAGGFVVRAYDGRYLSRAKRWIRHRDRSKESGAERAWAHTPEDLIAGGEWAVEASEVLPARYNPERRLTDITGHPFPFQGFIESRRPD